MNGHCRRDNRSPLLHRRQPHTLLVLALRSVATIEARRYHPTINEGAAAIVWAVTLPYKGPTGVFSATGNRYRGDDG